MEKILEKHCKTPKFTDSGDRTSPKRSDSNGRSCIGKVTETVGVKSKDVAADLLSDLLLAITTVSDKNLQELNATLAKVSEIEPKDMTEAMLAMQMISCHHHIMRLLEKVTRSSDLIDSRGVEISINLANKLMRTYTQQMETLTRYRRNGNQKIVVEHVTVESGGQAIVGSVGQGGKG